MHTEEAVTARDTGTPIETDVLVVGAGISGISAAAHLKEQCPDKRVTIVEARSSLGGTWDLFRYPGIRSDSDMHTFGFRFKPWTNPKALADGDSILDYLRETVLEYDLGNQIHYNTRVDSASWQEQDDRWLVTTLNSSGQVQQYSTRLLFMCSGYYNYESGYTPEIPGLDEFAGQLVHPQQWPRELDYAGKKVAVIGSGATAVTLVPAMSEQAGHVTMIQRSPTYIVSRPGKDKLANILNALLPAKLAYAIVRWRNIRFQNFVYKRARRNPEKVKATLLKLLRKELGDEFDIDRHFTPSYDPWTQRLCLVPDADLFKALRSGKASVVTGEIERITPAGVQMKSGELIEADVLVTATGLRLQLLGGVEFFVNDRKIDFSEHFYYQGMMFSDIPNLIQTFGYINASWTLRADLNSQFVCKLLKHMDATNTTRCVASLAGLEKDMIASEWITDFNPGYMRRGLHLFPRQGDRPPWINNQDYLLDRKELAGDPGSDPALKFSRKESAVDQTGAEHV